MRNEQALVAHTCAYAPLPLIHAAGFTPYRLLPLGDPPEEAGSWLHDNLCPHVKRVFDRALAEETPPMSGVVLMASCDAMRRLADGWVKARPEDQVVLVDLPMTADERGIAIFTDELARLREILGGWAGSPIATAAIAASISRYNALAAQLEAAARRLAEGTWPGGPATYQALVNQAVTEPPEQTIEALRAALNKPVPAATGGMPIYLWGNVLPDPEAMGLFADCGIRIIADDICTGSKQVVTVDASPGEDLLTAMARASLERLPCARTVDPGRPINLAERVRDAAQEQQAKGVIVHVMKFCDPYLGRIPALRENLKEAGLPLLVLEGDCSLQSLGQQRTRIEAFVEMLS